MVIAQDERAATRLHEKGIERVNTAAIRAHAMSLGPVRLPLRNSCWMCFVFPYVRPPPWCSEIEGVMYALPPLPGSEVISSYQRGKSSASAALRSKSQKLLFLRWERGKLLESLRMHGAELVDIQSCHAREREREELQLNNQALEVVLPLSRAL